MSNAQAIELERVVPIEMIAEAMSTGTKTIHRACQRHGVPVIRLSTTQRGLKMSDYSILLSKLSSGADPRMKGK